MPLMRVHSLHPLATLYQPHQPEAPQTGPSAQSVNGGSNPDSLRRYSDESTLTTRQIIQHLLAQVAAAEAAVARSEAPAALAEAAVARSVARAETQRQELMTMVARAEARAENAEQIAATFMRQLTDQRRPVCVLQ